MTCGFSGIKDLEVHMAVRDEELALLGILEASLGERQRALNGLHVDEQRVRRTMVELLDLERRIDQDTREQREVAAGRARHRRRGRFWRLLRTD